EAMKMTKIVVMLGFAMAFAAGLAVGLEMRQTAVAAAPTTRPGRGHGWLVTELGLTPQQQEQMRTIWDAVPRGGHDQDDRRKEYKRQRDEALTALVRPEDRARYDRILKTFSEQMDALDKQREES